VRNLVSLLTHFRAFILFIFFEIICFSIILSNNSYQQSSYYNSSRAIAGKLLSRKAKWVSYIHLHEINDSLVRENAVLKQKLGISIPANPLLDTSYKKVVVEDSVRQTTNYQYLPAKVINNSIDKKTNYITLDIGSNQGVKNGMAVISASGVVGKITHVSPIYSVAISVLSEKMKISARTPDGSEGPVKWDGKDPDLVTLTGIDQSSKIKPLDTIYTSGFSAFPEKVMIGRAVKVLGNTSYLIWLSTNFRKLQYVYVVKNETLIERTIFEQAVEDSIKLDNEPNRKHEPAH
jgi:rod shape-determining protein MreC